jgi:polysaccharide export outer membrane protein
MIRRILLSLLSFHVATLAILAAPPEQDTPRSPVASGDYIVGIEDGLRIVTWGETELTLDVVVRPDGKITIPLVNDVAVAGRTPEEIRQVLRTKLADFIREPQVTVIVSEINSYRVYFLGEVTNQGVHVFGRPVRLLQAIATAGGLTDFAKKSITLVREVDGIEQRIEIDYKRLLEGQPSQENLYLKPGDVLLFH